MDHDWETEAILDHDCILDDEQFQITDDKLAEWALKKVLEARKERDRLTALVEVERAVLDRKQERINKRFEKGIAYFLSLLGEYFQTVEHKKTKTQESYQLLSGKLVFKKPKMEYTPDNDKLLEWAKANAPEYVNTKESVAWGELKKKLEICGESAVFTDTGEIIDCVVVEEKPGVFDVKGE